MPADLQKKDLKAVLKEAETFAMGDYANALAKGDDLTGSRTQERD